MILPCRPVVVAALTGFTLAGCGSAPPSYTKAEIDDHSTLIPSVRVVIPVSRQREAPSEPQTGHAVEIRLSGARGDGSQAHGSGGPISLGGQNFNAPLTLAYDFEYTHAEAAYRWRKFFGSSPVFGVEVLGGIGFGKMDITASSATQRAIDGRDSVGLTLGAGGLWRWRPGTSVQARFTGFYSGDQGGVSSVLRGEVYLVQALGRHAALRAGYAGWQVDSDSNGAGSDIRLRFSGPALGLDVMF